MPAPPDIQEIWSKVPPDLPELTGYLDPVFAWLDTEARPGDYVLVQGDFGATCLVVDFAEERGLIPLYSTTVRAAEEEHLPDGTVRTVHHFQHRMFRRYRR